MRTALAVVGADGFAQQFDDGKLGREQLRALEHLEAVEFAPVHRAFEDFPAVHDRVAVLDLVVPHHGAIAQQSESARFGVHVVVIAQSDIADVAFDAEPVGIAIHVPLEFVIRRGGNGIAFLLRVLAVLLLILLERHVIVGDKPPPAIARVRLFVRGIQRHTLLIVEAVDVDFLVPRLAGQIAGPHRIVPAARNHRTRKRPRPRIGRFALPLDTARESFAEFNFIGLDRRDALPEIIGDDEFDIEFRLPFRVEDEFDGFLQQGQIQ